MPERLRWQVPLLLLPASIACAQLTLQGDHGAAQGAAVGHRGGAGLGSRFIGPHQLLAF